VVVQYIEQKLVDKSTHHRAALTMLETTAKSAPLSERVIILNGTPQLTAMNTILHNVETSAEDFIFYFDRLASILIEQYDISSPIACFAVALA
jgi:uridine kinase